jgi:hypothetical protein
LAAGWVGGGAAGIVGGFAEGWVGGGAASVVEGWVAGWVGGGATTPQGVSQLFEEAWGRAVRNFQCGLPRAQCPSKRPFSASFVSSQCSGKWVTKGKPASSIEIRLAKGWLRITCAATAMSLLSNWAGMYMRYLKN